MKNADKDYIILMKKSLYCLKFFINYIFYKYLFMYFGYEKLIKKQVEFSYNSIKKLFINMNILLSILLSMLPILMIVIITTYRSDRKITNLFLASIFYFLFT